jgi:hypothetical protein
VNKTFRKNITVVMYEGTCFLDAATRVEWQVPLKKIYEIMYYLDYLCHKKSLSAIVNINSAA